MASTTFSGPVTSQNGFIGDITGAVTATSVTVADGTISAAKANAVAAPATTRVVLGQLDLSFAGTTTFSGSQVGVRGNVSVAAGTTLGASGYVYGAQGKVTVAGATGGNLYGVVGQLDLSGASAVAAGSIAPVWADWGAASVALTGSAYGSLIRAQNTTSATLNSHVFLYGKASTVFDISSNGSACVDATSGGDTKAGRIVISVNGATRYLYVYSD